MEANKITVNVRATYEWHESDASRLRKPIEEHLLPALPAANYVAASITHHGDGFEQQEDFASALAWLSVLDRPAASYRLYLSQGANTLDLNVSSTNVSVGMRGEAARAAEFRAQLENFAAAAGLKRVEIKKINLPVLPARTTGFRRMGSYRLLEDVTADAWLKAVNLICAWVGDAPTFNGTLALVDDPGTVQDIRALAPWSEAVAQRWADLASAGMHAFQQPRNVNLQAQFADRSVTLNATAEDSEAVRGIFADFQSVLQVAPRVSGDFKGERRRFYIAAGIDVHWMRTFVNLLAAFKRSGFSGSFRIEDQEYSVQDFDAWSNELLQRWGTMRAAGGVLSNESSRHAFDLDFDREQIALDLRTRPGVPAVKTFGDYASELNLTPAPSNPYQYYRLGRRYQKLGEWDGATDNALADATAAAIAAAFRHGRYAFVSGSVTEGEAAEQQVPQENVEEFLNRLRRGLPFVSARIYLQGPLGYDLNVALQRRDKKVSLRSSIADAELFKEVARPFNKLHDLKEYEAEARNAAGEEQKKPSFLGSLQTQVVGVLAFILAFVTLILNTVQVPKTTLTLNLPKDGEEITGRSSPVRWSLNRKTVFKGEFPVLTRAHIMVAKEDESGYKEDLPNASPGDTIHFPTDGTYDVTVSVPGSNEGNARVTVKAAPISAPPKK